jgi:cell division septum initiation protein DivIVA
MSGNHHEAGDWSSMTAVAEVADTGHAHGGAPDIGKALLLAQQVADEMIAEAKREAARIVDEARATAPRLDARDASRVVADPGTVSALRAAFTELDRELETALGETARQLDSVRIKTSGRLALLRAELERVSNAFSPR